MLKKICLWMGLLWAGLGFAQPQSLMAAACVPSAVTSATLEIAGDNYYDAYLNGVALPTGQCTAKNCYGTYRVIAIPAGTIALPPTNNILAVMVSDAPAGQGSGFSYRLTINYTGCPSQTLLSDGFCTKSLYAGLWGGSFPAGPAGWNSNGAFSDAAWQGTWSGSKDLCGAPCGGTPNTAWDTADLNYPWMWGAQDFSSNLFGSGGEGYYFRQTFRAGDSGYCPFAPPPTPGGPTYTYTRTSTRSPTRTVTPSVATFTSTVTPSATPTRTATRTATPSSSVTPSPTATPTATPSRTVTPSSTVSPTPTRTATPTATPSVTPTYTVTPSSTQTVTPSATPTRTVSPSPSHTFTVTPSSTASATPTSTATVTPTATRTVTPSATPTRTDSPSSTSTFTQTVTRTITPSPTSTATVTSTSTQTMTPSVTPSHTPTSTPTPSSTITDTNTPGPTATYTVTPSPTSTATITPSVTPSATESATPSPTSTQTVTPTGTASITLTGTPTGSPTITETNTPGPTATYTVTPSPTFTTTVTPSITVTATPTSTPSPTYTQTATPSPSPTAADTSSPTPTCTDSPIASPTPSPTVTPTYTATPTFTATPSASPSPTATPSATPTSTDSPIASATATPTSTPSFTVSASSTTTPSASPSSTVTDSRTATPTMTDSPTGLPSNTVSPTASPTFTVSPTRTPPAPLQVTMRIYSSAGELVYSFPGSLALFAAPTGVGLGLPNFVPDDGQQADFLLLGADFTAHWNGTNDSGQTVSSGTYSVVFNIADSYGQSTTYQTAVQVTRVVTQTKVQVYNSAGELVWQAASGGGTPGFLSLSGTEFAPEAGKGVVIRYGSGAGDQVTWDGRGMDGRQVAGGVYQVKVTREEQGKGSTVMTQAVNVLKAPGGALLAGLSAGPNPATSATGRVIITLPGLPAGGSAEAWAYNLAGERICALGSMGNTLVWDLKARPLASGIYLIRVEAKDGSGNFETGLLKVALLR